MRLAGAQVPLGEELRAALGAPARATLLDSSPRSRVWRVELRGGDRVIVKQITEGGVGEAAGGGARGGGARGTEAGGTEAGGTEAGAAGGGEAGGTQAGGGETGGTGAGRAWARGTEAGGGEDGGAGADAGERFAREVAALRLAARAGRPGVAPALLGTDAAARVMALEYLDDLGTTGDWMAGYAETLARLHALTGPADAGVLPRWAGPTGADAGSFLALARALDVPVTSGVPGELAGLTGRLGDGSQHALLHGDPCPGNDLHTAGGVRFVDFEQAALGPGLVELAYLRAGFPTCWCALSAAAAPLAEAEAAYRSTWRDLTGTDVPGDLADACAGWLIRGDALVERARRQTADQLARVAAEDFEWGYVSARERLLHRLVVVAQLSREHDQLRELGQLCAELAVRFRRRWPALRPLPAHTARTV